jgi:hypothetical protein
MSVNRDGRVILAGNFSGTFDFDPSAGVTNMTSIGVYDIFMASYNGNLLPTQAGFYNWSFSSGNSMSATQSFATALVEDSAGFIYLTGYFTGAGNVDMDPSSNTIAILDKAFVAKYDSHLAPSSLSFCNWAFGLGIGGTAYPYGIDADRNGMVYVTGILSYTTTGDFDPSSNTAQLQNPTGWDHVFAAKYDGTQLPASTSFYQWAFLEDGPNHYNRGFGILAGTNHQVYVGGSFSSSPTDFDPSAGTASLNSSGWLNVFIASYDPTLQPSNTQFFNWVLRDGSDSGSTQTTAMVTDANGNIITTGLHSGDVDLDPGPGDARFFGDGMYVAKYGSAGNLVWAFNIPAENSMMNDITIDTSGNIYLAGYFGTQTLSSTIDFDPSSGLFPVSSIVPNRMLVASYNTNLLPSDPAFFRWAFVAGSGSGAPANGIAASASGNIYVTGSFNNNFDADPSSGTVTMSNSTSTTTDIYAVKYNGNLLPTDPNFCYWGFSAGGSGNDSGKAVGVDAFGDVFLTGSTKSTLIDLDPSSNTDNLSGLATENFIMSKYNGNLLPSNTSFYQWGFRAATQYACSGNEIAVNDTGGVLVAGTTRAAMCLDPSCVIQVNPSSVSSDDIFVGFYNGNLSCTDPAFGKKGFVIGANTGNERVNDIAFGPSGTVLLAGTSVSPIDLDPSTHTTSVGAAPGDAFFAGYDLNAAPASGSFLQWGFATGGSGSDRGLCISTDAAGAIYTGGSFIGNAVDFNPGPGSLFPPGATYSSAMSAFTAKYTLSCNPPVVYTLSPAQTICDLSNAHFSVIASGTNATYQWQENTGSGFVNLPNVLPYTGVNSYSLTIVPAALSMSGNTYRCVITACSVSDTTSPVLLSLNPLPVTTLSMTDSVFCINDPVEILSGSPTGPSGLFYGPGVSNDTLSPILAGAGTHQVIYMYTDGNGCAGRDTVNVVVNSLPVVTLSPSSTLLCIDDASLTLNGSPAGGTFSGPGMTGSSFDPSVGAGAYSISYVYTDLNGCIDTANAAVNVSACVGIAEQQSGAAPEIFPNPAAENVNLILPFNSSSVSVYNVMGELMWSAVLQNGAHVLDVSGYTDGIYYMRVENQEGITSLHFQVSH